jgi:hypothetical protein
LVDEKVDLMAVCWVVMTVAQMVAWSAVLLADTLAERTVEWTVALLVGLMGRKLVVCLVALKVVSTGNL